MAEKISLQGLREKKIKLNDSQKSHFALFSEVSPSSKIECYVREEGIGDREIFPQDLTVGFICEVQNKIQRLKGDAMIPLHIGKQAYQMAGSETESVVLQNARIDLALDGEVFLGDNDTLNFELTNLKPLNFSDVTMVEGIRSSTEHYKFRDYTVKSTDKDKVVPADEVKYLAFTDERSMPSEIELFYGQEIKRISKELILAIQTDIFGIVGVAENIPQIGYNYAIVLMVDGAEKIVLKNDKKAEFEFYGVNI